MVLSDVVEPVVYSAGLNNSAGLNQTRNTAGIAEMKCATGIVCFRLSHFIAAAAQVVGLLSAIGVHVGRHSWLRGHRGNSHQ